ncbi:substrate-binding domain-containing protein [Pseudotabrizicola alkalilacus]|uniref:ABC transporter substrate-binding protein n=1 Tax=Pseudotabrizicola alkalilacus TaxID=2305252 RepID=A0A411Z4P6_9RHOB|nr:substrate-binding domain-containing protein [Pseudotabrizicola alkalilacus]RGP38030.1 ABC transporter substrate-binding protein [Pseudotabrizicola alkalilacus]
MALRVLGPEAFRPALTALAASFAQRSGHSVDTTLGPATGPAPATITSRLAAGEDHDVVLLPAALTDQQIVAGRLSPEARVDVMRSMVALCVRAGAPVPDISTLGSLRSALRAAGSIGLSQAGSGNFVRDVLLARLDLSGLASRCQTITGQPVGAAVAAGAVEVGLQQWSELLQEDGITVAGPLPDAAQGNTVIAAATLAGREVTDLQRAFLTFLQSDAAAAILRTAGLQPVSA